MEGFIRLSEELKRAIKLNWETLLDIGTKLEKPAGRLTNIIGKEE